MVCIFTQLILFIFVILYLPRNVINLTSFKDVEYPNINCIYCVCVMCMYFLII